jgi:hypothetical protein
VVRLKMKKIHFKEENHEHDNQKVITDASLKVPHKFYNQLETGM